MRRRARSVPRTALGLAAPLATALLLGSSPALAGPGDPVDPATEAANLAKTQERASDYLTPEGMLEQTEEGLTSLAEGVLCSRRLPRGSCLKCLTALVTKTSSRSMPASSSAASSTRPAGPTKG